MCVCVYVLMYEYVCLCINVCVYMCDGYERERERAVVYACVCMNVCRCESV